MDKRVPIIATMLAPILPAGVAAATPTAEARGPEPIYSAFTLVKQGPGRTQRCGRYQITTATYTGTAISPDARMAGTARYTSRLATLRGRPTGVGSGTLTIHDERRRLRHRTRLTGVLTNGVVVNGLVSGNLYGPNDLILANVTIHFDDKRFRATFRIGLEGGANSGVAYPAGPRCP
jgi:hypothetical protein